MASAAQEWMEQGRLEGIVEGELKGKAETFLRLARLRFGYLSHSRIAPVRNASTDDLDVWLERLMTAKTLDDVFGGRRRH